MIGWRWFTAMLAVTLVGVLAGSASAGRIAMVRTDGQRNHGVRPDQAVPYLTNSDSGFGAYSVGPMVKSSPIVDDPKHPQARPVYTIIFYGGVQSFGGKSNGAVERTTPVTPR